MKILYATSEAVPFCKTGGLADVAGSLPAALSAEGAEVAVILPLYRKVKEQFADQMTFRCFDYVDLAWRHAYCGLFSMEHDGVTWYFLDNERYFYRPELYGYVDDGERFGFFSRAVVQMLGHLKFWPDVIHCNDWQTALIPIYLKDDGVREDRYRNIRTVMTVHNIEYQGRYGMETLGDLFGLDHGWADDGTIVMDGDVNLLKGALLCCDAINAVSPTYAEELKYAYFAHRMESIMRRCSYKLSGVLNGIDMKKYDPSTDPLLAARYSEADLSGKAEDKRALQQMMGLRETADTPIIGIVSRLVAHKGLDLICEVFHDIMELPVQVVVLGKGDSKYEQFFTWAKDQYPGRMAVRLDYNEGLAMAIYGGADLFLMPSKSEPCGLSQMIAMRYGTVPIVRETGGLKDTVHPYEAWRDAGTGFTFASYNSGDMLYVIQQAVELYSHQPDAFQRLQLRAMAKDFSWSRSARQYLNIYSAITGKPVPTPKNAGEAPGEPDHKPEDVGEAPAAPESDRKPEDVGETPAAPESDRKPEDVGETPAAPESDRKPEDVGEAPAEPEPDHKPEDVGEAPAAPKPMPAPSETVTVKEKKPAHGKKKAGTRKKSGGKRKSTATPKASKKSTETVAKKFTAGKETK